MDGLNGIDITLRERVQSGFAIAIALISVCLLGSMAHMAITNISSMIQLG